MTSIVNAYNTPRSTAGIPKYNAGSNRSVARLRNLNYDPIGELVKKYNELENELVRQRKIRSREIVELGASGKPRSFNPEIMMTVYDKQIQIAEKLLRYKYGRVPELDDGVKEKLPALIVNLTKDGETYVVNEPEHIPNVDQDDDTDTF